MIDTKSKVTQDLQTFKRVKHEGRKNLKKPED